MISRFSGGLLVLAGAYVTWYGWFEIRVLSGQATSDPIVSAALQVQGDVTRWVAGLGSTTLILTATALALLLGAVSARIPTAPTRPRGLTFEEATSYIRTATVRLMARVSARGA